MTVKELIKELQQLNQDAIVVMSKDSEGNGYSPLSAIDECVYQADCTWSGEIGYRELTAEMKKQGYTEEDLIEGEDAVSLWPTN